MTGKLVGYARTSTEDQIAGLQSQIDDLTAANCDIIFNEQVSSVADRPEFAAALAELQLGDTLVVTKMDRLARSILDLLHLVENFNKKGFALRILNLGGDTVDTRSATGRLMLSMLASFAQFEREMMLERQKCGIAKARAEGKYRGRHPSAMLQAERIIELHERGWRKSAMAKELRISVRSVNRVLEAKGVDRARILVRKPAGGFSCRKGAPLEIRAEG